MRESHVKQCTFIKLALESLASVSCKVPPLFLWLSLLKIEIKAQGSQRGAIDKIFSDFPRISRDSSCRARELPRSFSAADLRLSYRFVSIFLRFDDSIHRNPKPRRARQHSTRNEGNAAYSPQTLLVSRLLRNRPAEVRS